MKSIELDYSKRCAEEPEKGHNRWHPDIPPALEVEPEEEVYLQTRDALDGQCKPDSTIEFFKTLDRNVVHPLTGPVYVKGAKPGDLLEIDIIDVVPGTFGVHDHHSGIRVSGRPVCRPVCFQVVDGRQTCGVGADSQRTNP